MIRTRSAPQSWKRTGLLGGLACAFLALFSLVASAGGGAGSDPVLGLPTFTSPGDEVTSLPFVQSTSGLTFVGDLTELRALDAVVRGRGRIDIVQLASGDYAVTVVGDFRIELDRAALANSNIAVFFRSGDAFQGGLARLQLLDDRPVFLAAERVPLPLVRLSAAPLRGDVFTLDVFSRRGRRAHVSASLSAERVTLFQNIVR
jgi:hypothetical protein